MQILKVQPRVCRWFNGRQQCQSWGRTPMCSNSYDNRSSIIPLLLSSENTERDKTTGEAEFIHGHVSVFDTSTNPLKAI